MRFIVRRALHSPCRALTHDSRCTWDGAVATPVAVLPRGEVYSRDWTSAGWRSWSDVHGFDNGDGAFGAPMEVARRPSPRPVSPPATMVACGNAPTGPRDEERNAPQHIPIRF